MKLVNHTKRDLSYFARKTITDALHESSLLKTRGKMNGESFYPEKPISDALVVFSLLKVRSTIGGEDPDFHPDFDCDLTELNSNIQKAHKTLKEISSNAEAAEQTLINLRDLFPILIC